MASYFNIHIPFSIIGFSFNIHFPFSLFSGGVKISAGVHNNNNNYSEWVVLLKMCNVIVVDAVAVAAGK